MATHSFSHKHADACSGVEESIRNAFTRPGLSFQSFFCQEIPPLHASESLALSVYYLGNGLHLLCFLLYQGRHALSFLHSRIRNFRSGPGHFCAYDMFFLAGNGRVTVVRRKGMFNHPGWEAYWNGSGWHRLQGWRSGHCMARPHTSERFDSLRFSFIS